MYWKLSLQKNEAIWHHEDSCYFTRAEDFYKVLLLFSLTISITLPHLRFCLILCWLKRDIKQPFLHFKTVIARQASDYVCYSTYLHNSLSMEQTCHYLHIYGTLILQFCAMRQQLFPFTFLFFFTFYGFFFDFFFFCKTEIKWNYWINKVYILPDLSW